MAKKKARKTPTATPFLQQKVVELSAGRKWLLGAVIALVALILYAPSLDYGYTFDDDVYTNRNTVTSKGMEGMSDIFGKGSVYGFSGENFGTYRPLTLLSFALEKESRKPFQPRKSHWVNILLYALTVAVLWGLCLQLLPQLPWQVPYLCVLLFAVHPIHSEESHSRH